MKYLSLTNSPSTSRKGTFPSFGGGRGEVICLLLCLLIAGNAQADTIWHVDNITATFTEDNATLLISGVGEMRDYGETPETRAPWYPHRKQLKFIVIEDGITAIGIHAFSSLQPVESISMGDGVVSIGDHAFAFLNAMESITFGKNLKSIGNAAFWNCHDLKGVVLPAGLTTIGDKAFIYCSQITGIVIPASVETVGTEAFGYCSRLKTVTVECVQPPALGSGNFPAVEVIYVPEEALSLYRSAAGWSAFSDIYRTIEGHTAISAVEDTDSDDILSPSARYFTLQGQEVAKPVKGRIYIVKSGSKTRKMLVVK